MRPWPLLLAAALVGCSQEPGPRAAPRSTTSAALTAAPALVPAHADMGRGDLDRDAEARRALVQILRGDPDPRARRAALDRCGGELDPLLEALVNDGDALVRRWAALALERAVSRADAASRVRPALAQALCTEPDAAVRAILSRLDRRLAAAPG